MAATTDNRTATQRIEDLERVTTVMYQGLSRAIDTLNGMTNVNQDIAIAKEVINVLNKKTDAIIKVAAPETGITADAVAASVTEMRLDDMKAQVAGYLANGVIAPAEVIAEDSFVVCQESNSEGEVVQPRLQLRIDSQEEANRTAFIGKKVGETASFGENRYDAKILEIYTLVPPKAPEAPAAAPAAAETPAEAAPQAAEAAPAAPEATAPAETPAAPATT